MLKAFRKHHFSLFPFFSRLRTLGVVAFLLCLAACTKKNTFYLSGTFTNLRQAELCVYSTDGEFRDIDTINIIENSFKWEKTIPHECTFYIVFPNLSEYAVFAKPGKRVKIKGDGNNLRALEITGTTANDTLTNFRLRHLTTPVKQQIQAMKAFVANNEDGVVTSYFRRQINILQGRSSRVETGKKLPKFTLLPDAFSTDTLKLPSTDKKQRTLLVFWASWKHDSKSSLLAISHAYKRTQKAKYGRLRPISISLDADTATYRYSCRVDSIEYPTRCTGEIWSTPIVGHYAIREIPYYILTDSLGIVRAQGSNFDRDIQPHL